MSTNNKRPLSPDSDNEESTTNHGQINYEVQLLNGELAFSFSNDELALFSLSNNDSDNVQNNFEGRTNFIIEINKMLRRTNSLVEENLPYLNVFPIVNRRVAEINALNAIEDTANGTSTISTTGNHNYTINPRGHIRTWCTLEDFGIMLPPIFIDIFNQDNHFITESNLLVCLPAKLTVRSMLTGFICNNDISIFPMIMILHTFDKLLPYWFLYEKEHEQFKQIIERNPLRKPCEMYGLSHIIRFILRLPRLFMYITDNLPEFVDMVSQFLRGFIIYMMIGNDLKIDEQTDYIDKITGNPREIGSI